MDHGSLTCFPKTDKWNYILAYLISFASKCPKLINQSCVVWQTAVVLWSEGDEKSQVQPV